MCQKIKSHKKNVPRLKKIIAKNSKYNNKQKTIFSSSTNFLYKNIFIKIIPQCNFFHKIFYSKKILHQKYV